MANASIDSNSDATLTAALNTDGDTITRIKGDPSNHSLKISDGTTGTDYGPTNSLHDENGRPTLMAVASETITVNGVAYVEGVTPVVIYADSSGNLLVDST